MASQTPPKREAPIYIGRIAEHLADQGAPLPDGVVEHTSPIRAHLNVYGRYDLHSIKTPKIGEFRPLRNNLTAVSAPLLPLPD